MTITLHYFNVKGASEGLRMMLAYSGIEWKDNRIELKEWGSLKSKMPHGVVPVLELEDGTFISQSLSIALYIAELSGLLPADLMMRTRASEVAVSWFDFMTKMHVLNEIKDKATRMVRLHEIIETFVNPRLKMFEDIISNSKSGYVTENLSYADFLSYNFLDGFVYFFKCDLNSYPALIKYREKIANIPKVQEYLAQAPDVNWSVYSPFADRE